MDGLRKRNVEISEREIAFLSRKFIGYLALAHQEARGRIKYSMAKRGGYILHVDGTCDTDSPHLFSGLDGLSKIVLDNIKIPSEHSAQIIPFLKKIKTDYGVPLAMVHDMGASIIKSMEEVFPGVPDYICHFHFLRDIGRDLLTKDNKMIKLCIRNRKIRGLLRLRLKSLRNRLGDDEEILQDLAIAIEKEQVTEEMLSRAPTVIAYALLHWAFDASSESNGYGFPFDRPHFVFCQRLVKIQKILGEIRDRYLHNVSLARRVKDNAPLVELHDQLTSLLNLKHIRLALINMEQRTEVFDKMRAAMNIAMPSGTKGLNDDGDDTDLSTIEERLTEFRRWLDSRKFPYDSSDYTKVKKQLDQYWDKLLADPINVESPDGPVKVYPQRTNNVMERLFRDFRHGYRRKTGSSKMNRAFRALFADTPLTRNLQNEEYKKIILNGSKSLAERFAVIEATLVREKLAKEHSVEERLTRRVTRIVRRNDVCAIVRKIFAKAA